MFEDKRPPIGGLAKDMRSMTAYSAADRDRRRLFACCLLILCNREDDSAEI